MRRFAFMICLLVLSRSAGAFDWTLTTSDFRSQKVTIDALDGAQLTFRIAAGDPKQLPVDQLLSLASDAKPQADDAKFVAITDSGDRIGGAPASLAGETLRWNEPALGEISLPMKSLRAITSGAQPPPDLSQTTSEDVITLGNGDSVRGIVTGLDEKNVGVQLSGGDVSQVPLSSIARIVFASTAPLNAGPPPRGFRLTLADRSAVTVADFKLVDDALEATTRDGVARKLPLDQLLSIEQINGPVVWLGDVAPSESVQTPTLQRSWPARIDRAVDGSAIRFGATRYLHGIGVHSYSRLTFPIDPSFASFRTQFAIAGDRSLANVTVRIKLDDLVVFEKADVISGVLSEPVVLPISGHKSLTLEVDYGQNEDVEDRLNWIEPALLRHAP